MSSSAKKPPPRQAAHKMHAPRGTKTNVYRIPEKTAAAGEAHPRQATTKSAPAKAKSNVIRAFTGDATDVIRSMRSGIPAQVVPDMARQFGLTQEKLFEQLRLPRSTMKARIVKNEALSPVEQDRMYRAERVWERALEVLEEEEAARLWISRENRALGGEAPLSLLDTEAGYELVLDTLGRIEYGVVS